VKHVFTSKIGVLQQKQIINWFC